MGWELLKYLSAGFLVFTWVAILLTQINSFDMNVLHNHDAYWIPVSVLSLIALVIFGLARNKVK